MVVALFRQYRDRTPLIMIINNDEIDWLNQNYPSLAVDSLSKSSVVIRGDFKFKAAYSNLDGGYVINPRPDSRYSHPIIEDSYNIEIFSSLDLSTFPNIRNTDGRLLSLAEKYHRDPKDFHVYSEPFYRKNSLCVVGPIDASRIKGYISLRELLNNILLPFFYDSSHYENYGSRPREDYSHGVWGVLENYYDLSIDDVDCDKECINKIKAYKETWPLIRKYLAGKNMPKGHHLCIVCRKEKIRICHNKVFRAMFRLYKRCKINKIYVG